MSNFTKPRVKRGPAPAKRIKRHRCQEVLPELMRDFDGRCAYSMQHHSRAGKLEVDHFDPRLKKKLIQDYENLFPASRHCNSKKSNKWPNREEIAAGCRFLNPCKETDYGAQIFEDPNTHQLVGINPAARWHIRICGLNAERLVNERAKRAKYWKQLENTPVSIKGSLENAVALARSFREEVKLMIPQIPSSKIAV